MENKFQDILNVAGGNKEIKVGVEKEPIILLGFVILFSVFIATYAARKLS